MPHQCTNCGRTFADGSKEMLSGCPDCGGNKFQFRPAGSDGAGAGSDSSADAGGAGGARPETSGERPGSGRSGVTGAAANVGSTVRDWVGTSSSDSPASDSPTADSPNPSASPADSSASSTGSSASSADSSASSTESSASSTTSTTPSSGSSESASQPSDPGSSGTPARSEGGNDRQPIRDDTEDSAQASARSDVVSPEELSAAATDPADRAADPSAHEEAGPDLSELREELNDQFESIKIVSPGQYELNLMELYDRDEYIISLREDGRYVIEVPDRWDDTDET